MEGAEGLDMEAIQKTPIAGRQAFCMNTDIPEI